jgi:predicted nucleic acid-binding protein
VILYLDTSALVKLYVEESGSHAVAARLDRADSAVTVRVTYAEARAAFARHRREGGLTAPALRRAVRQLDGEWGSYDVVDVSDPVVRRAGNLAERHVLRAYDAVQLAAALEVRDAGAALEFACFDDRLARAASRERLRLIAG